MIPQDIVLSNQKSRENSIFLSDRSILLKTLYLSFAPFATPNVALPSVTQNEKATGICISIAYDNNSIFYATNKGTSAVNFWPPAVHYNYSTPA